MRWRVGTTRQPAWVHNVYHIEQYSTLTGMRWAYWTGLDRDAFTKYRDKAGTWQTETQAWWAAEEYDLSHYYTIRIVRW